MTISKLKEKINNFLGILPPETIEHILDEKVEKYVVKALNDLLNEEDINSWPLESKNKLKVILKNYYTTLMVGDVSMVFEEAKKNFLIDVAPERLISEEFLKTLSDQQIIKLVRTIDKITTEQK